MEIYDLHPPLLDFTKDVIEGLSKKPKSLNPMYLYDETGSELFEKITELKEYYPTKTEVDILRAGAETIDANLPEETTIVEFGSGSSNKIKKLLDVSKKIKQYIPIEISKEILVDSCESLIQAYPKISFDAICANYTNPSYLGVLRDIAKYPITIFFPGSTVGNLERAAASDLLRVCAEIVGEQGRVIIGIDLYKDKEVLRAAYDDSLGVTAAFNLNLIDRINRQLDSDFDKGTFAHKAVINESLQRVEMHLESLQEQNVTVENMQFSFSKGETIHTESSHKYTDTSIDKLFASSGLAIDLKLAGTEKLFSVIIARNAAG